jgi:hypothetical protein
MSNPEANFMLAAEKAIADLQDEVKKGRTAARRKTAWNIILSIVAAATILLGLQLHQQAVSSCQAGNDRATGTIVTIDRLTFLLEGPHPSAKVQKAAAEYEAYVAQHNAPRNCTQAYHIIP